MPAGEDRINRCCICRFDEMRASSATDFCCSPQVIDGLRSSIHAGAWLAEEVELAYGGVAPKAIMAPKTEAALTGKP